MRRHPKASLARSHKTNGRGALGLTCLCLLALAAIAGPVPVAAAEPPPGRAYELVSPIDDPSGGNAGLMGSGVPIPGLSSENGERFLYGAAASLGDTWSGQTNAMIFGRRTATGWKARTATVSIDHGNTPLQAIGTEAQWGWMSPAGDQYVFQTVNLGAAPVAPDQALPGIFRARDDGTAPEWLTQPLDGIAPLLTTGNAVQRVAFANRDTSVVAIESKAPLTAEAPSAGTPAVYASRAGSLELASRLPGGTAATEESVLVCNQQPPAATVSYCSALAGDGRFVLFRTGNGTAPDRALYVRDLDQQETRQLAGPGVSLPEPNLVAASRDGSLAYFTRDEVSGTYEANLETGDSTLWPAITGTPVGLSDDGRGMLFVEGPSGGGTDSTLRYWDDSSPGTSVDLGSLGAQPTPFMGQQPDIWARVYRVLGRGRTWIFSATGSLDPARPNAKATAQQLYRWTVGEDAPTCLSCESVDGVARTTGVNLTIQQVVGSEVVTAPTVTATIWNTDFSFSWRKVAEPGHATSNDGRLILFDSPDRLVAEDTNNIRDVYLWDRDGAPGHQLQLVTSGKGISPSYALDIDPSGRDLFFSTQEGLVPADRNGNYNVYDARVGGGFPGSQESCAGEACRPPEVPPLPASIGSGALSGDGNVRPVPTPAKPSIAVVRPRAAGSVAKLRVRVSGPGRISVSGPLVRQASRSVARAGTYAVTVRPNARAKSALAKKQSLKVRARVSYRARGGRAVAKTVTTTFAAKTTVRKGR